MEQQRLLKEPALPKASATKPSSTVSQQQSPPATTTRPSAAASSAASSHSRSQRKPVTTSASASTSSQSRHSLTPASTAPLSPFASPIPTSLPTITIHEYCLYQLNNLFNDFNEQEFAAILERSPYSAFTPGEHSLLAACRTYSQLHPDKFQPYAKRFGGGAAPYHPFCE